MPLGALLLLGLWLGSCNSKPATTATLTMKQDGTHFFGTVVRRDANSITLTSPVGDTHTFFNSEISGIQYGAPETKTELPAVSGKDAAPALPLPNPAVATPAGPERIQLPAGAELPVRTNGFIDSCCVRTGTIELGAIDAAIRDSRGETLVPQGASVTFLLRDEQTVFGRLTMQFELASADFGNRHYVISSVKGGNAAGAVVTFSGPREGSPEALSRGASLHLDENSAMMFKAATPVVFRSSQ